MYNQINPVHLFYSKSNMTNLSGTLYWMHQSNGGHANQSKFNSLTPKLMKKYMTEHDLSSMTMLYADNIGIIDTTELLKGINQEFIKHCAVLFQWNIYNPFTEYVLVGDSENPYYKQMNLLNAEEIPTVRLQSAENIYIGNKNYRDNNQIPYRLQMAHNRHYDRSNEGLDYSVEQSSRENPIYGYDMTPIYNAVFSVKKDPYS